MSFKSVNATLASAVANAGTFTVAYPDGHSAGDFVSYGHVIFVDGLQAGYTQDAGKISVAFGASEITVTNNSGETLPAASLVICQFNKRGADDRNQVLSTFDHVSGVTPYPLAFIDLGSPDAADPNGIVESQDLTAAGVYSVLGFNGVYGDPYGNDYAVLDVSRNVVAAWTGNAQLTVTGKDANGDVIVETSAAATTSLTGKKAFKEITSIATDADITALTVGTGDVLGLPVFLESASQVIAEYEDGVTLQREPPVVRVPFQIDETDLLAGTPISLRCPVDGTIRSVQTIVWKAVGTGGNITANVNNTAVDGLAVVVADSAPAGALDSDTPTAGHASTLVSVDDELELVPAAAFATTGAVTGFIEVLLTAAQSLNGTLVAGVQTAPTATTGDVKGTYDPTTACDGATAFGLLAFVPDPNYLGVDNYDG